MASTGTQHDKHKEEHKTATSRKSKHGDDHKSKLAEEIGNFYGVDYKDNDEQFIKEVSEVRQDRAKRNQDTDPQQIALVDAKIDAFRQLTEDKEGKLSGQQKALRKKIEDEYQGVSITFPSEETWQLNVGGKVDSGNMSVPEEAILASAGRLRKVPAE